LGDNTGQKRLMRAWLNGGHDEEVLWGVGGQQQLVTVQGCSGRLSIRKLPVHHRTKAEAGKRGWHGQGVGGGCREDSSKEGGRCGGRGRGRATMLIN